MFDEVISFFFFRTNSASRHTFTASPLFPVHRDRNPFDVALVGNGDQNIFFHDQVFDVDVLLRSNDLRSSLIAVLLGDFLRFLIHNP